MTLLASKLATTCDKCGKTDCRANYCPRCGRNLLKSRVAADVLDKIQRGIYVGLTDGICKWMAE